MTAAACWAMRSARAEPQKVGPGQMLQNATPPEKNGKGGRGFSEHGVPQKKSAVAQLDGVSNCIDFFLTKAEARKSGDLAWFSNGCELRVCKLQRDGNLVVRHAVKVRKSVRGLCLQGRRCCKLQRLIAEIVCH
jgi:hypothetical protein